MSYAHKNVANSTVQACYNEPPMLPEKMGELEELVSALRNELSQIRDYRFNIQQSLQKLRYTAEETDSNKATDPQSKTPVVPSHVDDLHGILNGLSNEREEFYRITIKLRGLVGG